MLVMLAEECLPSPGGGPMTYVIAEPCVDVKNQSCVDVCPVSCIYIGDEAADRILYINPDECIECGACEPECPVTAIFHDSAVPADGPSTPS